MINLHTTLNVPCINSSLLTYVPQEAKHRICAIFYVLHTHACTHTKI